jgi:hypothetical protein
LHLLGPGWDARQPILIEGPKGNQQIGSVPGESPASEKSADAGYNSDMDCTAPDRRWYRFSLRTMLVVVAAVAVGLGWITRQRDIVTERTRIIDEIGPPDLTVPRDTTCVLFGCVEDEWMATVRGDIPLTWRLLGAQAVFKIILDSADYTEADAERYSRLFPEASIDLNSADTNVLSIVPLRWR